MSANPAPTLPPREPRPYVIHFLVDTAVCFLAILILGLIWGIGWVVLLLISVMVGAAVAPLTRRAEERQLAQRVARETDQL
jgi:hypothetical protein